MSDRDIILHLATKVMGWKIRETSRNGTVADDSYGNTVRLVGGGLLRLWNPLEKWDDVMEIQEKVMADPKLSTSYTLRMHDIVCDGVTFFTTARVHRFLLSATPRQRCLAIVEATS